MINGVLVVEHDREVKDLLRSYLTTMLGTAGFVVCDTGLEAWQVIKRRDLDLAVARYDARELTGPELVVLTRSKGLSLPFVIYRPEPDPHGDVQCDDVLSRTAVVQSLDYDRLVTAAFQVLLSMEPLIPRRRVMAGLVFDPVLLQVVPVRRRDGSTPVSLTRNEFYVLLHLAREGAGGRVSSCRDLMTSVGCEENTLRVIIHRLRRKLQAYPVELVNVRGHGYVLEMVSPFRVDAFSRRRAR